MISRPLAASVGLLFALQAMGQTLFAPLSESRSAQSETSDRGASDLRPKPTTAPSVRSLADAEALMLPVRSALLSPGIEPRRRIQASGLPPLFLIGDDPRSRAWLQRHRAHLEQLHALGLVVNVASAPALATLRQLAPALSLAPVSADDLAARLGIHHYPVLITATDISP